ncbi:MAG: hypothetical protein FWC27_03495 [Firmicutes bacterium]|nr:hypothetical protein [Bacillota bacterium]
MELILIPGNEGRDCPGNWEECDECDYLMCCTNHNGLCENCFAENGGCPEKILDIPPGICYT